MREEKRTFRLFMAGWAPLFIVGAMIAWQGDKLAVHGAMNAFHAPALDVFFAYFTHLADGLVPTALSFVLLLTKSWRAFLMMGLSCGLSALAAQSLKHGPCSHLDRPSLFREQLAGMPWVDGIDLHAHFSFPSGHSTAAFGMCLALAVVLGRARLALLLVLLAALLGYARIYLSQHFLQDVVVGSLLGVGFAALMYHILFRSRWSTAEWLNRRPFLKGGSGAAQRSPS